MESFYKAKVPVKLQRFIKSYDGPTGSVNDIRAIVVGDKVVSAMERGASNGDFRANLSQGGKAQKVYLSEEEKKVCVNAAKALGLEFAGVDLMRERGKPHGKTDSCYVTEVNGNPGTGIIDVTKHNHFLNLVEHVAKRNANKAKSRSQDSATNQTSALSSYPTEMIHAEMNPQQAVDAFAKAILNDATPEKIHSLELLGERVLENADALEPQPVVDDMTIIAVDLHIGEDHRYRAYINATKTTSIVSAKHENFLSEASERALEMFKSKMR